MLQTLHHAGSPGRSVADWRGFRDSLALISTLDQQTQPNLGPQQGKHSQLTHSESEHFKNDQAEKPSASSNTESQSIPSFILDTLKRAFDC